MDYCEQCGGQLITIDHGLCCECCGLLPLENEAFQDAGYILYSRQHDALEVYRNTRNFHYVGMPRSYYQGLQTYIDTGHIHTFQDYKGHPLPPAGQEHFRKMILCQQASLGGSAPSRKYRAFLRLQLATDFFQLTPLIFRSALYYFHKSLRLEPPRNSACTSICCFLLAVRQHRIPIPTHRIYAFFHAIQLRFSQQTLSTELHRLLTLLHQVYIPSTPLLYLPSIVAEITDASIFVVRMQKKTVHFTKDQWTQELLVLARFCLTQPFFPKKGNPYYLAAATIFVCANMIARRYHTLAFLSQIHFAEALAIGHYSLRDALTHYIKPFFIRLFDLYPTPPSLFPYAIRSTKLHRSDHYATQS